MISRSVSSIHRVTCNVQARSAISSRKNTKVYSTLGLDAHLKRIAEGPNDVVRTVIDSSTVIDFGLTTRLIGAVFGYEGEKVFPSIFQENYSWTPSDQLLETIKLAVQKELTKDTSGSVIHKSLTSDSENDIGDVVLQQLYLLQQNKHVNTQNVLKKVYTVAEWPVAGLWIQYNGVADHTVRTAVLSSREACTFTTAPILPISTTEKTALHSSVNNVVSTRSSHEFNTTLTTHITILHSASGQSIEQLDSRALLNCAADLITYVVAARHDQPICGYSVVTDGHKWRFVALQLHTLDFNSALTVPHAVKNGVWVYEIELFTLKEGEVVINKEVLCILHSILTNTLQ